MSLLELIERIEDMAKDIEDIKRGKYSGGGGCPCDDGECSCLDSAYDTARDAAHDYVSENIYDHVVDAVRDVLRDDEIVDRIEALENNGDDDSGPSVRYFKGVLTDDYESCNCHTCQKNRVRWVVAEVIGEFFETFYLDDDGYTVRRRSTDLETDYEEIQATLGELYDE